MYVAARRIRKLQDKKNIHPANAILLGEVALRRFWGPTIWGAYAMCTREFAAAAAAAAAAVAEEKKKQEEQEEQEEKKKKEEE